MTMKSKLDKVGGGKEKKTKGRVDVYGLLVGIRVAEGGE